VATTPVVPKCPDSWTAPPAVDPSLTPVGPRLRVLSHGSAKGEQWYWCRPSPTESGDEFTWTVFNSRATVADCHGAAFGEGFGDAHWLAQDGSFVRAEIIAETPSKEAGAVPWHLLQVTDSGMNVVIGGDMVVPVKDDRRLASGALHGVTHVLRTGTAGGGAPSGGCDAEHARAEKWVPFSAEYWFLGP
jgi:hypothetical protein